MYGYILNAHGVRYRSERKDSVLGSVWSFWSIKRSNVIIEKPVIFLQTTAKKWYDKSLNIYGFIKPSTLPEDIPRSMKGTELTHFVLSILNTVPLFD